MAFFGPVPSYKLEPYSLPYLVYRNIEGYRLQSSDTASISPLSTQSEFISQAWDQTMYYKHKQKDYPIHGNLLMKSLLEDSLSWRQQHLTHIYNSKNSVLGVTHEDQSLVIHTSGRMKDRLILRNSSDFRPYHRHDVKGFTVQLDSEIIQLEKFGMGTWNTCSHILARSRNQLFHLKTTDISDKIGVGKGYVVGLCRLEPLNNAVILEPIQKWVLNHEISCLSGSKSISAQSYMLNTKGELFSVSPLQGVVQHSTSSVFSPTTPTENLYHSCLNIESSHHPLVCFLSKEKLASRKDLRTRDFAQSLFSTHHFITSIHIPSYLSSNTMHSHQFFLGCRENMYVMDDRYLKTPLALRTVPETPSIIRSLNASAEELYERNQLNAPSLLETEILVSGGGTNRQICGHIYGRNGLSFSNKQNYNSDQSTNQGAILSSFSGIVESTLSWEIVGFPVIDRETAHSLRGMDIIPISSSEENYYDPDPHTNNKKRQSYVEDSESEGLSEEGNALERDEQLDSASNHPLLLLCQQSNVGDVFCQRIQLSPRHSTPFAPIQSNAPVGVRCKPFPEKSTMYSLQTRTINGMGLGRTILLDDLKLNTYPLASGNFTEFVTDRELKRFSILQLNLEELLDENEIMKLSNDHLRGTLQETIAIQNLETLRASFRPLAQTLVEKLSKNSFMTLWEIWKFLAQKLNAVFTIELLRQLIASECSEKGNLSNVEVFTIYFPREEVLYAKSDGLRVKITFPSTSKIENPIRKYSSLCTCHHQTTDESDDSVEEYDSFDTFARESSYSQSSQRRSAFRNKRSTMNHSVPASRCCGKSTCLVPHLLVYKIKNQFWSSEIPESSQDSKIGELKRAPKQTNSDITPTVISSLKEMWDDL